MSGELAPPTEDTKLPFPPRAALAPRRQRWPIAVLTPPPSRLRNVIHRITAAVPAQTSEKQPSALCHGGPNNSSRFASRLLRMRSRSVDLRYSVRQSG